MPKFVSVPTEIEAIQVQYDDATRENNAYEMAIFVGKREEERVVSDRHPEIIGHLFFDEIPGYGEVWDKLHKAWIPFKAGDWIIKGTKGEFYPCDNDVFKTKYRPVIEGSNAYK